MLSEEVKFAVLLILFFLFFDDIILRKLIEFRRQMRKTWVILLLFS